MYIVKLLLKTALILLFLEPLTASEESVEEFIEHVLKIPNPDRVLNSVLGRLERNRQFGAPKPRQYEESQDCEEPSEALPEYTETLESSRERGLRQLGAQKHYPICHLERKIRRLNTNEYEYRPAYYEEVRCTMTPADESTVTNERLLGDKDNGYSGRL